MQHKLVIIFAILTTLFTSFSPAIADAEINIYSARKEYLIKPLLDKFTESTKIQINLVTGKANALLKRLEAEGMNTPADLFLTTDAGRLHLAKSKGLLQPVASELLNKAVPAHLRDTENYWVGLSQRSRVIIYSKERVRSEQLSSYENLADPQWKGKICIRSSNNIYNQSLLASLIAHHGLEYSENWAKSVVANMGRSPKGNDRAQVSAVAIGECDVAIVNNYYVAKMMQSKKQGEREAASKIALFYPNQEDRGAHMNVSGIAVTAHSKNRENATKLIEFLISDDAQQWYAEKNNEYPVRSNIKVSDTINNWGFPFKQDNLNMSKLGEFNAEAVKIFDRAGWK